MIFILTSFGFNSASNKIKEVPSTLKVNEPTAVLFPKNKTIFNPVMVAPPFLGSSYIGFKEALAFKESQGDYFTINALGYLGKYQFGIGTLQLMGVYNATRFINDPMLQEKAFHTNIARNKWILRRDIKRFDGKRIRGVKVTESGILAAAHLAGAGNVKKFLRSFGEYNVSDEFGTSIAYYMRKFSGYDISHISPVRNPKI
tara:strand:- start:453 stop:1055 length:603 start_codon:yes stop_codon:yes gene_type:complete